MNAPESSPSSQGAPRGHSQPSPAAWVTFRTLLDEHKAKGQAMSPSTLVRLLVPLCSELNERHARGEAPWVYPSNVLVGSDGQGRLPEVTSALPSLPRDRECLAPECRGSDPTASAASSVYAVGMMLYEALTLEVPGTLGLRPPSQLNAQVTPAMEAVIGRALVADVQQRPKDLAALANALHLQAPRTDTLPPSVTRQQSAEFDVEFTDSFAPPPTSILEGQALPAMPPAAAIPMMPPGVGLSGMPQPLAIDAYGVAITQAVRPAPGSSPSVMTAANDPTSRLAALKARLESNPDPIYVVVKNRMDHGPFTAVELLQQIVAGGFAGTDELRDLRAGSTKALGEHDDFLPFLEQAQLNKAIVEERKQVAVAEKQEKVAGRAKLTVASGILVLIAGIAGAWILHNRGERNSAVSVADDPAVAELEVKGGVKGHRRAPKPGGGGGGAGGGGAPGGMSYEAALASNNQEITIGQKAGGPDLTDAQLAGPMRNAAFLGSCGAPTSMKVTVKVAVKMGRAIGVTVVTNPGNPAIASCIDRAVRGLAWPAHPKMDTMTTSY